MLGFKRNSQENWTEGRSCLEPGRKETKGVGKFNSYGRSESLRRRHTLSITVPLPQRSCVLFTSFKIPNDGPAGEQFPFLLPHFDGIAVSTNSNKQTAHDTQNLLLLQYQHLCLLLYSNPRKPNCFSLSNTSCQHSLLWSPQSSPFPHNRTADVPVWPCSLLCLPWLLPALYLHVLLFLPTINPYSSPPQIPSFSSLFSLHTPLPSWSPLVLPSYSVVVLTLWTHPLPWIFASHIPSEISVPVIFYNLWSYSPPLRF